MFVIGTAGHIDHGKSTLVKALTGIDPDRLREEKERGMTIDLGFAWVKLPSGRDVSIVDVPGHERFIRNMLAGVGGIDLALLVIAADEGIMPQTEEHLSILELLRVKRAVIALTKKDLVEPDWLELVRADVADRLARSPYRDAPIVEVSAVTGEGLDELRTTLDRELDDTPPKPNRGRPRLPIDRVFTISGFGTVVTGTLIDGPLSVGDELEILPGGTRTRARGIQTHKLKVESAMPGARVAVNLNNVAVDDIARGQVLTAAGWLRPTTAIDAHLRVLPTAPPLLHNAPVSFHTGSAEVMGRVRLLEFDSIQPGQDAWVQIHLAAPVAVVKGDLFVIRSPNETLGGGEIVEAHARRHRRRETTVVERLQTLERGSPDELVLQAIAGRLGADSAAIAERTGLPLDQVSSVVDRLIGAGEVVRLGDHVLTAGEVASLRDAVTSEVAGFHQKYPLRPGMPREDVRSRLRLPVRTTSALLERLVADQALVLEDSIARLPGHHVSFSEDQRHRAAALVADLEAEPYSPPTVAELAERHGVDEELLAALATRGDIVRVNESIAFGAKAFGELRRQIVERTKAAGSINVAEVRDMFQTSRRYALAVMEYFDQQRLTRRVGDARVLR
jgi:selenocysteine-specific elongation factor